MLEKDREKILQSETKEKELFENQVPQSFWDTLEKGIYKELHRRKLLSDAQLNSLLSDVGR